MIFFRLSANPSNSEEKQFGNNSGEISQQWYFAFARISKARNQSCSEWTHPWWTCSWWNLPFQPRPADPSHLRLCLTWFSQRTEDDVQGASWFTQFAEEWHSQIVPPLFSSPALPLLLWSFQAPWTFWSQNRRSWRGAWRGLGTVQLEAGLKFLDV